MTYSPDKKTVDVVNAVLPPLPKTKNPPPEPAPKDKTLKLLAVKKIPSTHVKYFVPLDDGETLWNDCKTDVSSWRYNPVPAAKLAYYYARAYAQKRTNITPYEFALLALNSVDLTLADFTLTLDAPAQKNAAKTPDNTPSGNSPLTAENRPLIVEIYNASGQKGAALTLTQHLRSLNEKKLLNIDVFQYDTNPKTEDKTQIIDYSGRTRDLKSLSLALGLTENEFLQEKTASPICDARIIIGKDFKMPK